MRNDQALPGVPAQTDLFLGVEGCLPMRQLKRVIKRLAFFSREMTPVSRREVLIIACMKKSSYQVGWPVL